MNIGRRQFQIAGAAMLCASASTGFAQTQDIVIGQVASLSGTNGADLGLGLQQGILAYLNVVNARGGVGGKKLRLVSLDDRYLPDETVRLTREMIDNEKPVALTGYRGTANTLALVKSGLLLEKGVPLVGTLSGAAEIQGTPMVYHLRTSYPEEISQLVLQLARLQITRIGLFFVDDAFGNSGREAFLSAATLAKSTVVAEAAYDKAPNKIAATMALAVAKLAQAKVQAVVMIAVGDPVYTFVKAIKAEAPRLKLFSISVVNPAAVIEKVGLEAARGMGFSQVFPYPYSDGNVLAREYRAALKKLSANAVPGYFSLEGYVYARVLVAALQRAGKNPTPASVKAALDDFPDQDFGGFGVRFNRSSQNASSFSDLTIISSSGKLMR